MVNVYEGKNTAISEWVNKLLITAYFQTLRRTKDILIWSSYKEHKGNALAPRADEGRD